MDYVEWAKEYEDNALLVKNVMERKKHELAKKNITADTRKRLNYELKEYRCILSELTLTAKTLRDRAEALFLEA